ncbi:MAG: rod shape-determining protein MreC [Sulfurovum sp.]
MLIVLLSRNDERISNTLLGIINPIKQSYKSLTQDLENKSHSYIFQKESIEKLSRENRILRKRLLEQVHYIKQVKNIYDVLPDLSHLPVSNISLTDTISYVKLNSFSQIILTKPKGLKKDKIYGLMQGKVVAGIARERNSQLYGYLTSDDKCRFSVFIGDTQAPGIALGREKNQMLIKFIPKWHKIKVGDSVVTSGLDDIFFVDIPVGVVTKIEVQSSYTVAHIKTYSDIFHPKTFFLINDARESLSEGFNSKNTKISIPNYKDEDIPIAKLEDKNIILPIISSIPKRIDQTQEDIIEPEIPIEEIIKPKPRPRPRPRYRPNTKPKPKPKPKPRHNSTLDLF